MKLTPRNWSDFQHYDKRRPPWIKLHRALLDNFAFQRLPVASRALAPMLWLLASESDGGCIDADLAELAFRLRQTERDIAEALKPLIEGGFFDCEQDASKTLASVEVSEHQEERSEERSEERVPTALVDADGADPPPVLKLVKPAIPPCDFAAVAQAYHEALPMLPAIVGMSRSRREHVQARWREVCAEDGIATREEAVQFFRDYFAKVSRSKFLLGQGPPKPGGRPWRATFDWLILPANFLKVVEGNYDEGRKAS